MQPGFHKKLKTRKENNQIRHFTNWEGKIDFFSNDYLGIAQRPSPDIEYSLYGSTGSRLLSGHHPVHEQLEETAARFFNATSAILYNSGYDANLGLFSALPQKGETVIYDQKIHASIRDGIRLSNANAYSFKHNDIEDLKAKIEKTKGIIFVAIESIYSMDGDCAPIDEICAVCEKYDTYLIIDEAHAVGVFGENGQGLAYQLQNKESIIRIATFGKAFGAHGAVVLGSKTVTQFLMNFSRSFIYTTAISIESVNRLISSFEWIYNAANERTSLRNIIAYFSQQINTLHWNANGSPIQYFPLKQIDWPALSNYFEEKEIAIKPIFPPTVAEGEERLRISLHSYNTKMEIDLLIEGLKKFTHA